MIAIIDYEMGNIRSLQNALDFLGCDSLVTRDPKIIASAKKIILPGVGTFDLAMKNLIKFELLPILNDEVIRRKKTILGICLGMQVFASLGEENGATKGLGWINGRVMKIDSKGKKIRFPHIGFNSIEIFDRNNPLFRDLASGSDYYFDHGYVFEDIHTQHIASYTTYGVPFVSSIHKDSIYGTQFHPEKSQSNGLKVLKNFISFS